MCSPGGSSFSTRSGSVGPGRCGGGSVETLVADFGPLPPRYAAELLRQLLGALDTIHTAGVLHRDVKPANLLLEATGTARPVLRLTEPRLTIHGTVVGTPGYLAPEALAGATPAPSQDLYAAGVTAWQLLTGSEPPERGTLPARPLDAVDPIWDLVTHLTQPDPRRPPPLRSRSPRISRTLLAERWRGEWRAGIRRRGERCAEAGSMSASSRTPRAHRPASPVGSLTRPATLGAPGLGGPDRGGLTTRPRPAATSPARQDR
ncbi:hypothetical protein AB0L64_13675 [Kribbella sp. NPDC051936]|uniref:protein kinase domain-containing protein n=1 Tax=Kribbella sp. NPDC051936 TaxID=3154946 RepID=UPI003422AC43